MHIKINSNRSITAEVGENLLAALVRNKIAVPNLCNGQGTCGKCKVRFLESAPHPSEVECKKLSDKELAQGIRLACAVMPWDNMAVEVDEEETVERKKLGQLNATDKLLDSGLRAVCLKPDKPSLADERADWDRVMKELQEQCQMEAVMIDLPLLEKLPRLLREGNFVITVVLYNNEILDLYPGDKSEGLYGVAIDIGTTNVAVALVDLKENQIIKVISCENAQTIYGADVISRISFANESQANRDLLQQAITGTINTLLQRLCVETEIDSEHIYKATLVANTAMHHLFLGLDVQYLAVAPFTAACNTVLTLVAGELGIAINRRSKVVLFPNVGGFVGGDLVGAVLASREAIKQGQHLLLDIGTNCELILKYRSGMIACSTAAGPAFEGAGITYGSRAQPGAIESIQIDDQGVEIKVIGNQEATSICGSGLIEAVGQMKRAGIINKQGSIQDPEVKSVLSATLKKRIRKGKFGREFVLAYGVDGCDVVLNQRDISQLQLAKGAVGAGIKTILEMVGMTIEELDTIILAGTFASYLDLQSILDIGLVPMVESDKIKLVGNAAHVGAVQALVSQESFKHVAQLASDIRHAELGGSSIFVNHFTNSMYIEPYI